MFLTPDAMPSATGYASVNAATAGATGYASVKPQPWVIRRVLT